MPRVSILIPTYSRSWGLKLAIESALAQTVSDFELIVADDCSSDDTAAVVETFTDRRIHYFRQPRNVGMYANWGACVERACGEFVVFLADDDTLGPTFLEHRLPAFQDPTTHFVFTQYEKRSLDGSIIGRINADWDSPRTLSGRAFVRAVLEHRCFIGSALYRTTALKKFWPDIQYDDLVLDYSLNLRMALGGECARYLPVSDFYMTSHPGQNSQAKTIRVFEQAIQCINRLLTTHSSFQSELRNARSQWMISYGRTLMELSNIRGARAQFLESIRSSPFCYHGWFQFAKSFLVNPSTK